METGVDCPAMLEVRLMALHSVGRRNVVVMQLSTGTSLRIFAATGGSTNSSSPQLCFWASRAHSSLPHVR